MADRLMVRPVKRLVEYMRSLVVSAKGNVVSISLKKASRALGAGSKAEAAAVKAVLDALASLGLLEAAEDGKPRYVLRRGSPLWAALEAGHVELIAAVASKCSKPPRRRRRAR
jgi:hypothetical protein